jgi:carboxyl-terminal processing protease
MKKYISIICLSLSLFSCGGGDKNTESNPADDNTESNPTDDNAESNPVYDNTESNPADDNTEPNPVDDNTESNPVDDNTESNPADDNTESNPTDDNTESNPADDNTESNPADDNTESDPPEQSSLAKNYLSEVLNIMRKNSVTRNNVDWGNIESEVNTLAANVNTIKDTFPAITKALELIGTHHSFLRSSSGDLLAYHSTLNCEQSFEINEPFIENIGYLKVNGFSSDNDGAIKNFATNIQNSIAQQDNENLLGWVVDLRDNTGGNMWSMIAGLGPFFDETVLGHFIDVDENFVSWGYENGSSLIGNRKIVTVDEPYLLLNLLPKIAILSSNRLASSGEATLIAFKKQFNVRVFGTDTCGLSTANKMFKLSDGSELILTTAIMADREQNKYGHRVPVDQIETQEDVLNKAIEWLQK